MVNTFLVDEDYQESARQLDSKRLGKQRVEAYQVLRLCLGLRYLGNIWDMKPPLPNDYNDRIEYHNVLSKWINDVRKKYQKLNYLYLVSSPLIIEIPKDEAKNYMLLENQWFIRLGFVTHPLIRMWFGYEESLKLYINEHINEWIKRGYLNNMNMYKIDVKESIEHPPWIKSKDFHENHRSALLHKEIVRAENPWYIEKEDFRRSPRFTEYNWLV